MDWPLANLGVAEEIGAWRDPFECRNELKKVEIGRVGVVRSMTRRGEGGEIFLSNGGHQRIGHCGIVERDGDFLLSRSNVALALVFATYCRGPDAAFLL